MSYETTAKKNLKNLKCTSIPASSIKQPITGLLLKSFNKQVLETTKGCLSFLKDRSARKTFSGIVFKYFTTFFT